ncbi:MAG: 50S ribosomal protein L10 [Planctomycetota bacterium]
MANVLNQLLVNQYQRHFEGLEDVVAIDYSGLNSEKMAEFRDGLRKSELTMEIVKNRIVVRALQDAGLKPFVTSEEAADIFRGQTAFVFGDGDGEGAINAAKFVTKWLKANKDSIKIKGGQMSGDVLNEDGVVQISTLPGKKELLSMMAGGFLAVPTKMAATMQASYARIAWGFNALAEKLDDKEAS